MKLATLVLFLLAVTAPAFAQTASGISPGGTLNIGPTVSTQTGQAPSVAPDDRYAGYPSGIPIVWPNALPDLTVCQALEYYLPADFHLKQYVGRLKVAGKRIQQYAECAWMLTRYSWRYVMRPPGTVVLLDAQGRDLFDEDCGNPRMISVSVRPPEPPQLVEVRTVVTKPEPTAPAPPSEPVRAWKPPPPPAPMPEPEEDRARFGVTASVTPRFSTSPVNGLVSSAISKDVVCVDGYALDLGLAWGKPKGSFLRVGFSFRSISDGSSSRIDCPECGASELIFADGAVRQYGVIGEAIWRMPIGKHWPIQPMISAHGGFGGWSGKARSLVLRPTSSIYDTAEPGQLLDTSVFGGIGAGLVGGNNRWTGTGAVVVESPTGLGARVTLTRWF